MYDEQHSACPWQSITNIWINWMWIVAVWIAFGLSVAIVVNKILKKKTSKYKIPSTVGPETTRLRAGNLSSRSHEGEKTSCDRSRELQRGLTIAQTLEEVIVPPLDKPLSTDENKALGLMLKPLSSEKRPQPACQYTLEEGIPTCPLHHPLQPPATLQADHVDLGQKSLGHSER